MPPVRYVVQVVERRTFRVVVEGGSGAAGWTHETVRALAEAQVRTGTATPSRTSLETESVERVVEPARPRTGPGRGGRYQVLAVNASESEPDKIHEIRRGGDGVIYCTCQGWAMHQKCWHMRAFRGEDVIRSGRTYGTTQTTVHPGDGGGGSDVRLSPALVRARELSRETGVAVRAIILRG